VTKDRKVLIENSKGFLEVISFENLWSRCEMYSKRGEKEIGFTSYKTLSWCHVKKKLEMLPIKEIIRHKTNKKIYSVSSNAGRTCITEDHSLIDEFNTRLKFDEVDSLFSPKKSMAEVEFKEINNVDMLEYMDISSFIDFPREVLKKSSTFGYDDNWLYFSFDQSSRKDIPKIKRIWNESELLVFCRYLAFFIGDGSISTPHSTKTRYMWAINSEKLIELENFKVFMESMTENINFNIIKSSKSDSTFKLSSGTKLMAYFMRSLIGQKATGKKMPSFVFNLSLAHKKAFIGGLLIGDGSQTNDPRYTDEYMKNNFTYCTQSEELANQLSVLLSMYGFCFSVHFREEKKLWTLATSSKNRIRKPSFKEIEYDDYVYDLSVEKNENFFDCMGLIGLHNTDSVFTKSEMKTGKELGAMKLEYKCKSACFVLPKTYVNEDIIEEDGTEKPIKLTMKGFDYKHIRNAFTFTDFVEYLTGDLGNISVTEKPKFCTFKSALKMGKFVTLKNEPTIKKEVDQWREDEHLKRTGKRKKYVKEEYKISVKMLQGYYNKRKIAKGGFDTYPIKMMD
jgi:intein/homing endonuclease